VKKVGKKKKKKGSGEDRVKVNVSTVESKKKEHLQTLMQAIGDYITVDHIGDIAASEDKNIGDEEVEGKTVSIRDRRTREQYTISEEEFLTLIQTKVNEVNF